MRSTVTSVRGRLRSARYRSVIDPHDPGHIRIYARERGPSGAHPRLVGEVVVRENQVTYAELNGHVMAKWPTDSYPAYLAKLYSFIRGNPAP